MKNTYGKITKKEMMKIDTTECVEEYTCTNPDCNWQGLSEQLMQDGAEGDDVNLVCPCCANEEHVVGFISKVDAVGKYVKQERL